jgi:hypothetical protein
LRDSYPFGASLFQRPANPIVNSAPRSEGDAYADSLIEKYRRHNRDDGNTAMNFSEENLAKR